MTITFNNNPFLHPIRGMKLAFRRWLIRGDVRAAALEKPEDLPPPLQPFQVGETLPWKGQRFKVAKIVGDPIPMIMLVPVGLTKGAKLRGLRNVRDIGRRHLEEQRRTARALRAEAH